MSENELKAALSQAIEDKNIAEDRLEFEINRLERQYKSKVVGIAKKYSHSIGLELDGLEDILEFMDDCTTKNAISERINRIREKLLEIEF